MKPQHDDGKVVGALAGASGESNGILSGSERGGDGQTHLSQDASKIVCVKTPKPKRRDLPRPSTFFVLVHGDGDHHDAVDVSLGQCERVLSLLGGDDGIPPYLTTDDAGTILVREFLGEDDSERSDLFYDGLEYRDPDTLFDEIDQRDWGDDPVGRWDGDREKEESDESAERCHEDEDCLV